MELFDKDGNLVDSEGKILKTKEELAKANAAANNPPKESGSGEDPVKAGNPQGTSPSNSADDKFRELESKIVKLTEQYAGSTKEALRLKEENDKLQKEMEELRTTGQGQTDEEFDQIANEKGLSAAVDHLLKKRVRTLEEKIDGISSKEAEKLYKDFKNSHKGLSNPDILAKFEAEHAKLSTVYDDPMQALDRAYILAGGPEAEKNLAKQDDPKAEEDRKKAEAEALRNAGGNPEESTGTPAVKLSDTEKIKKQIEDLEFKAAVLANSGRDNSLVLTEIDELRYQLK